MSTIPQPKPVPNLMAQFDGLPLNFQDSLVEAGYSAVHAEDFVRTKGPEDAGPELDTIRASALALNVVSLIRFRFAQRMRR